MNDSLRTFARLAAGLTLQRIGHDLRWALISGTLCFLIIAFWERRSGRSLEVYASRHFVTDLLYRAVFITYLALLYSPLAHLLRQSLPWLDRSALNQLPLWIAIPVYWIIFDFLGYWIHRAQHSRILWRFHRVHHSQEIVTFASGYRNHPIDQLFALAVSMIPGFLLGAPSIAWVPYVFMLSFIDATHHARLPWRLGPMRRLFVSPVFHMAHHSTDPAVYNRNFGGLFSMWDFIFGTAYDATALPERTGVSGWQVKESFWAHLLSPFSRRSVIDDPKPQSGDTP